MQLYEYQERAIASCLNDPSHSQLISMPTGTGKTITFLNLAKKLNKKTLIIVHREELLNQTYEKAKLCGFKESDISLVSAEKKEKLNLLNIAMVQSLSRNIEKYNPEDIEVMIIDEAHHATANSYVNIIKYFQVFEKQKNLFGFTATPLRSDKDHLSSIFLSHSFKMTLSEATMNGYIVPVHGIRVEIKTSLKDIDTDRGDYDISQLDKVMNCDSINELITDRCKNLRKCPGIIFCTSVAHAEELAERLRKEKRKAISISYKTPKKTLARIYEFLKKGKIEFITNAVKLSEGFDHPQIGSVIIARPTRSPVLYKQMIGRGLRNYPGKHDCFILEFTGNDPKMMRWEDIDETATFQCCSAENKKTIEEAKRKYKEILKNPEIEILGVRISPFEFYECRVRRYVYYKKFMICPFTEGFFICETIRSNTKTDKIHGHYFSMNGGMYFWDEKYKSFHSWGECNYPMTMGTTQPIVVIENGFKEFAKLNKLCTWYPSEYEPVTRYQKKIAEFLTLKIETKSARKAEFEIENRVIKKIIDKFMLQGEYVGQFTL